MAESVTVKMVAPTKGQSDQVRAVLSATLTSAQVSGGGDRVSREVSEMTRLIADRFNRPWRIEALTMAVLSGGRLLISMVGLVE